MKKLLLKLAAIALFALSPHITHAQEVKTATMKLTGWRDTNPNLQFGKQMIGVVNFFNTGINAYKNTAWPSTQSALSNSPLVNLPVKDSEEAQKWTCDISEKDALTNTTTASFGYGQITDGTINIDFNFNEVRTALSNFTTNPSFNNNCRWAYSTQYVAEEKSELKVAGLNIYPGVAMKFTAPGKRIKRLIIHTGLHSAQKPNYNTQWNFRKEKLDYNLQNSISMDNYNKDNVNPNATMEWRDVDGLVDIVITSSESFGTTDGFIIKVKPSKSTPSPLEKNPTSAPADVKVQNYAVFNMESVEVEYYEEKPFVTESTGNSVTTNSFQYYNPTTSQFENITADKRPEKDASRAIEKVKIGDVIFEIDNTNVNVAGNYSVWLYTAKGVGLFPGSKFRMYLDPEKYSNAKTYSLKAIGQSGTVGVSALTGCSWNYANIYNLQKSGLSLEGGKGMIVMPTISTTAKTPEYIFRAVDEAGVDPTDPNAGWIVIAPKTGKLYDLTTSSDKVTTIDDDVPVIFIAAADIEASTDEVPTPATGTPEPGTGAERSYLIDGVYKFLTKTSLTPKSAADLYLKHSFYYIISDEALTADSFDKSKATKISEGDAIKIDKKCVLNVLTVGEYSKGEVDGALNTYSFESLGVTLFDNVQALNKPENDGKLVALNCLVNPIAASGTYEVAGFDLDHNSAANGYLYHTYARDIYGDAVKFTTYTDATSTVLSIMLKKAGTSSSSSYRNYLTESAVVGVFHYNDGRPEIRVIDQKATETYDYSTFLEYNTLISGDFEALKHAGLTVAFKNAPCFVTEPSKDNWGSMVRIRHLTFNGKDANDANAYIFNNADGKPVNVRNFISGKSVNPAAGTEYTLIGFVDYDADNGYFLVPTYLRTPLNPLVVNSEDASKNTTITDATVVENEEADVDLAVSINLLNGKLEFNIVDPNTAPSLYYVFRDMNADGKAQNLEKKNKPYSITSSTLTWVDGMAHLAVSVREGSAPDILDESDLIYIKVFDGIAAGFTTETVAGLREEYAGKNPAEVTDGPFVTITNTESGNYGKIVVAGIYDKYILVRDIPNGMTSGDDKKNVTGTDLTGKNDYILVKADEGWIGASGSKIVFPVTHQYYDGTTTRTRNTTMAQGDALKTLVARVTPDANGNWMLDATGTGNLFKAFKKYQPTEEPRMAAEIDQLVVPEVVETITEADLNKLVKFKDVNVAAGTYKIGTSDNILAWNYLSADDKATSDKAAIDGATAGAEFTVTGLVMRAADGALAVEVISLEGGYDKVLDVCEHQDHDSYYADQEFAGKEKLVKVNGVKITRTGDNAADYAYQLRIKTPVTLDWKTTDARADVDKALIDAALTDGTTTAEFVVSGFLKNDGGVQTLDVIAFEQVPVINDQIRVYAYWDKKDVSLDNAFQSYSVPRFTYNPKNYNSYSGYYDATEVYNISYKMLPLSEIENLPEDPSTLTDDELKTLMENVPLKKFDPATFEKVAESCFIYAESCTPGKAAIKPSSITYIKRIGLKAATLADVISEENTETYTHYTGNLRVLGANPTTKTMALTDGTHIISAYVPHVEEMTEDVVAGAHIGEVVLSATTIKGQYYRVNSLPIDNANVPMTVVTPEAEIAHPETVVLTGAEAVTDIDQKAVKLVGAKIYQEGKIYVAELANPNGGTFKLPLTIHLGWDPATLSDNPDADYIVKGYVFQRVDPFTGEPLVVVNPKGIMPLDDEPATGSLYTHEIWAASVELREQTPAPVITVSGAESVEGNKAVTIEDVTVSIVCEEETAKIEYSTDGGNTWTAYDDTKPVVIKTTATVAARAQGEDMSMSATVTMEIVRETLSGKAAIDPDDQAGYTPVTIRHEDAGFAGKYEVRYTTDGSEPTADSQLYTAPLELEEACTVKAILKEEGKDRFGASVSEAVSVRSGDLKITATRAPGKTTVRIEVADTKHFNADGAVIFYSKNNGDTDEEYHVAGGKNYVEFDTDKAITVVAHLEEQGKTTGKDVAEDITVDPVTTDPTDPEDPTPAKSGKVVITATEGDGVTYVELAPESQLAAGSYAIHYTLDGSEPTAASTKHDGNRIEVRKACTIKAVLIENGKTAGEVAVKQIAVTGIDGIAADGAANVTVEGDCIVAPEGSMVFDMTGRRVRPEGLRAGIYIVRLADGTAVKVAVR